MKAAIIRVAGQAPALTECPVSTPDQGQNLVRATAAIANSGMTSWTALSKHARLKPGETVFVKGATGTSGRLAVRIARVLAAGRIVATGRKASALEKRQVLGVDVTIRFCEDMEVLQYRLMGDYSKGVDIVLDYLCGPSALNLPIAAEKAGRDAVSMRFARIGSISAPKITLATGVLRAPAIELMGSGGGSIALPHRLHHDQGRSMT